MSTTETARETFQMATDAHERGGIGDAHARTVLAVGRDSADQRDYVQAVEGLIETRDRDQQMSQVLFEVGQAKQLDELFSSTVAGDFLDPVTATPWHQHRAAMVSADVEFLTDPSTVPGTVPGTVPVELAGLSFGGEAFARLLETHESTAAVRVYEDSVAAARKTLADDRAEAARDEALAEFDQELADRVLELDPIEVPDPLEYQPRADEPEVPTRLDGAEWILSGRYQPRADEPEVPTFDLYPEGTIQGDREWYEAARPHCSSCRLETQTQVEAQKFPASALKKASIRLRIRNWMSSATRSRTQRCCRCPAMRATRNGSSRTHATSTETSTSR